MRIYVLSEQTHLLPQRNCQPSFGQNPILRCLLFVLYVSLISSRPLYNRAAASLHIKLYTINQCHRALTV